MTTLPVRLDAELLAVETRGLEKRYGSVQALSGVDVQVPEGSVYLLVGPNGAGKSTLLRTLLDLVRPTAGAASVFGLDCQHDGPRVRAQIGYVPEHSDSGYGWMTVGRLMEHQMRFFPAWDVDYAGRLADAFDLRLEQRFGKLSKGQARRVQLAMALAHRPPLLVLDEPTDGLDPVMRDELLGVLADHLAETPTTMLVSTHLVHEVEGLADHLAVIRNGELRAQVTRSELQNRLRRYRAEVPAGWGGSPALNGAVLRRVDSEREILWTVWGEERAVVEALTSAGATVREAAPLTLEDAALALLSRKETAR
ncbi:MAG TPA: ABC transporter ATP-binding protein [Longimicrobiaceae bacterium]|nr:ABC transporter ATP-binding protein [Longimicrobiaceae bacterium]